MSTVNYARDLDTLDQLEKQFNEQKALIVKALIEDRMYDYFSINWSKLRNHYGSDGRGRRKRMIDG